MTVSLGTILDELSSLTQEPTTAATTTTTTNAPYMYSELWTDRNASMSESEPLARRDPNVAAGIALAIISLLTVFGNILVIAAVTSWRKLRHKITSWFVVSLALSDVLVGFLVMSWNAAAFTIGYWPFGRFCAVHQALDIMMSTASILNLCVIALDRFWAVTQPFDYQSKMTRKRALLMIACVWIVSCVMSFVPVLSGIHTVDDAQDTILANPPKCDFILNGIYAVLSSCISFYVPSIVMIITYLLIYREARRQEQSIRSQNRVLDNNQKGEHKAAKTLGAILGVFVFCWLPFFVVNCILPFCKECISGAVFTIVLWLGWINSSLNPLIYATNREFRTAFKRLLCKKQFLRDRTMEYSTTVTLLMHMGNGKVDSNKNERKKKAKAGASSRQSAPAHTLTAITEFVTEESLKEECEGETEGPYPEHNIGPRLAKYQSDTEENLTPTTEWK
ncbi:D(1) dopamine receptor-like [Patiria miniata]|uniref:G-protein coupled receptors family 1 profile domain-containing protein n=1 Tax=Patiria miniata TaxID=46514 RepID=A0A913Z2S5_PATMI|nr:D(1) dopamine receptor-like [Patiria miniata]XP_038046134.1 D(1) dopamine receptor-like [Patiria miniata]XP_038046136.1 D(1) dopamine receptor-like [Patiria miniata]